MLHAVKGNATEILTHEDVFLLAVETILELSRPDVKSEQIGFPLFRTLQAVWKHWKPMGVHTLNEALPQTIRSHNLSIECISMKGPSVPYRVRTLP